MVNKPLWYYMVVMLSVYAAVAMLSVYLPEQYRQLSRAGSIVMITCACMICALYEPKKREQQKSGFKEGV